MSNRDHWALLDLRGLVLHAYNSGTDPDGYKDPDTKENINTVPHTLYNFVDIYLEALTRDFPLNRIIAVCEGKNSNHFRREELKYDLYKSNRKSRSKGYMEATNKAFEAVKELVLRLGIPLCSLALHEADDVIAYLVRDLPGTKEIYTVDGDLVALASDEVAVFVRNQLKETFGECNVPPHLVTLYKSIAGDSSDNYPGVKGLGPAFWKKLIAEYGLDGVEELSNYMVTNNMGGIQVDIIDRQPGNHPLLERLIASKEQWLQSWNLAKLYPERIGSRIGNLSQYRLLEWRQRLPLREKVQKALDDANCPHLLGRLAHLLPQMILVTNKNWDQTAFDGFKQALAQSEYIAIDLETWAEKNENFIKAGGKNYVDMFGSRITGLGITCGRNSLFTCYFSFDHADAENNLDRFWFTEIIKAIPKGKPIICHNTMFERTVILNEFGIDLYQDHPVYDTMLMASHVDEMEDAGLKDCSHLRLNYEQTKYEEVVPKGKTMRDITSEEVFHYGADDPFVTAKLFDVFYRTLQLEKTWEFVRDYECNVVPVLSDAYLAGVTLDLEESERQRAEDQETYDKAIARIRELLKEHMTVDQAAIATDLWVEELAKVEAAKNNSPVTDEWREETRQQVLPRMIYKDYVEKSKGTAKKSEFTYCKTKINVLFESVGLAPIDEIEKPKTWMSPHSGGNYDQREIIRLLNNREIEALTELHNKLCPPKKTKVEMEGTELNINSPIQNQRLFYGMLGLPIRVRNFEATGKRKEYGMTEGSPQANEDAINTAIAFGDAPVGTWQREVLDNFLAAKKCDTRIKLFYSKFPLWVRPESGLIYPQFRQCGTETRRPTGSNPNLLQLSKKGEGVKVRRVFLPNHTKLHNAIFTCDWSAQELRVNAGLAGDQTMIDCYVGTNLKDLHSVTAAGMAGVSYEEFIKVRKDKDHPKHKEYDDIRKSAKSVVFLSQYGGGAVKLARKLLCDVNTATKFLDAKKETYHQTEVWKNGVIDELNQKGCVRSIYGSVRHLFNKLNNPDQGLVSYYQRAAVNYMIQGSCADILKRVLATLYSRQILKKYDAVLVCPIYDELVISLHTDNAVGLIREVYDVMTEEVKAIAPIPLLASPAIGPNMGDQIEILEDENDPLTDAKILAAVNKMFASTLDEAA